MASDIYNNKLYAEHSYMQSPTTRVVTFEMCGNDGLQARSSFAGQTGTCNYGVLNTAQTNCTTYVELAMQAVNTYAHANTKLKVISNLYYPGYDADNGLASCTDSFAQYMAADYDSNNDGLIDSEAIRYVPGESESAYVSKLVGTYRATLRDGNLKLVSAGTSFDYFRSDYTYPTYTGATLYLGLIGGSGSGTGAPEYSASQIVGGQNPVWNRYGHERMGWGLSVFNLAAP